MVNYYHLFNKYILDRQTFKDAQEVFLNYLGKLYCIGAMGKDKAIQVLSTKEAVSNWCDLISEISQMVNY